MSSTVSVWPNPASNLIHIETKLDAVIEIKDLSGKTLLSRNVFSGITELPLNLKPGLYILRIRNYQINTIKLIIK